MTLSVLLGSGNVRLEATTTSTAPSIDESFDDEPEGDDSHQARTLRRHNRRAQPQANENLQAAFLD